MPTSGCTWRWPSCRCAHRQRSSPRSASAQSSATTLRVLLLAGVVAERPRRAELAQLVADHALGDVHRHVLAAVVDGDGVADHVGDDRAAPAPGLDHLALAGGVLRVHLLQEVVVDERALLQAAGHCGLPPALRRAATAHDQLLRWLVLVAGAPLGLAPRRHGRAATGRATLAATERVVDGVHGHAAGLRTDALPTVATGLADLGELVLAVADLPDSGAAVDQHATHLGGRQAQGGELALLGDQLDGHAGRAGHLAAAAGTQLDVVDRRTDRDVAQRERVARLDVGALTARHVRADVEALGRQDVGLLAVGVVQQGDAAGAVRVVLDGRDLGGDAVLDALEVDDAVLALVPATTVARRL